MSLKSLKLKALSDVARFKQGVPLTLPGNVAEYYRTVANDGADRPIALNNDAIVAIVQSVDGNDEDAQDERVRLMLKADGQVQDEDEPQEPAEDATEDAGDEPAEPETDDAKEPERPVEQANAVQKWAATLIADTRGDKDFNGTLEAGIAADKELKMAPLNLMARLRAVYGDRLNGFPVPGTKAGDRECGNNPPDKRRTMVKKKDGGFREKYVSSIDAMFDATEQGARLNETVRLIGEANSPDRKAGNPWSAKNVHDRSQALQDARSDITTGRGMLRKAIALHLHLMRCDSLPDVDVTYRVVFLDATDKSKGSKPRSTRYPIVVKDKTDEENVNYYSVTQFLGLDPDEAKDPEALKEHNGSVWAALCASGGRGAATNASEVPHIATREQAEGYLSEVAAWAGKREAGTNLHKWMADKDGAGLRLSVDAIVSELTAIRDAFAKQIAADKEAAHKLERAA